MAGLCFSQSGITVTEKIKLVILPAKVATGWDMDEVDFLLGILEEQALELGRFQLFPRTDIQQIMKERNLSELGVTEALEIGKLGGSKYALLLTLTELSSSWNILSLTHSAVARYTIRLYNIENGSLLASKSLESRGASLESAQKAIGEALKATALDIWYELRRFFRLEAYVKSVSGSVVKLAGLDPKLAKKGYVFQIETHTGDVGYVKVVGYDRTDNTVVTQFMYGHRPSEYDIATEYEMMPYKVSLNIGMFSNFFGIGLSAWGAGEQAPLPVYFHLGTFMGNLYGLTPVFLNLGGNINFITIDRINGSFTLGGSFIALIDLSMFEIYEYLFGVFGGLLITYEFNPKSGVYGSLGYAQYLDATGPSGLLIQIGMYF
ncbi:hypothetical protein NA23_02385 [Fervidobacterium islandicum]|uniref:Uncharacterized protein n=1 Tax=Fervidobacterium islandicum TaxID=2423 RepID=A0AAI8GCF8_FERIS|nr:hypothetical protein [Fervidobacterium islandicum]AMW32262.1 hypothetical protein NA23_02385 [Fervidobacterium islandicum]